MLKNCKTLKQVVQSLFDHYHSVEEKSANVRAIPVPSNNSVIIMNAKTGKQAIARCRKGDTYDYATGVAIAWAKYTHRNPRWEENITLNNLKVGEMFTREEKVYSNIIGEVTYVVQDFVDDHAYCRKVSATINGPCSNYKRFNVCLVVRAIRTLY